MKQLAAACCSNNAIPGNALFLSPRGRQTLVGFDQGNSRIKVKIASPVDFAQQGVKIIGARARKKCIIAFVCYG